MPLSVVESMGALKTQLLMKHLNGTGAHKWTHKFPKCPDVTRISKMKIFPLTEIKFHLHFDGLFGCNRSAISSFQCNINLMALYKPKKSTNYMVVWCHRITQLMNYLSIWAVCSKPNRPNDIPKCMHNNEQTAKPQVDLFVLLHSAEVTHRLNYRLPVD